MNQPDKCSHPRSFVDDGGDTWCPDCQKLNPGTVMMLKPLVPTSTNPDDPKAPMTIDWKAVGVVQEVVIHKEGEVIVLGIPPEDVDEFGDSTHNCDQMGCGQCHVLWRNDYLTAQAAAAKRELIAANKGAETNAKVNQLMAADLLKARTALETIRNMEVYLVDAETNPDAAFMRDFYRAKLVKAVEYAAGALERGFVNGESGSEPQSDVVGCELRILESEI